MDNFGRFVFCFCLSFLSNKNLKLKRYLPCPTLSFILRDRCTYGREHGVNSDLASLQEAHAVSLFYVEYTKPAADNVIKVSLPSVHNLQCPQLNSIIQSQEQLNRIMEPPTNI